MAILLCIFNALSSKAFFKALASPVSSVGAGLHCSAGSTYTKNIHAI